MMPSHSGASRHGSPLKAKTIVSEFFGTRNFKDELTNRTPREYDSLVLRSFAQTICSIDMKNTLPRILFLQLPRLDNDSRGIRENLPMAGFYLRHSLEQAQVSHEYRFLTPEEESLDDHHLLKLILDWKPDVIAATLYLWNIERTLHILRKTRRHLRAVNVIVGGPEVAHRHPFLYKSRVPDMAVVGEGEPIFPSIIEALCRGIFQNFARMALKTGKSYVWGSEPVPSVSLDRFLPPPDHPGWKPDSHGMAYLETGRGCPLGCIYCRYAQSRRQISFLRAAEVKKHVKILIDRGAREIRFVDPVFNVNPEFQEILRALLRLNSSGNIAFFAEIQADLLTPDEISLLADAGFREVEAGVQSLDPLVLKRIHRPVRFGPLEKNLQLLFDHGIRVTIDLMYGLPGQSMGDVETSLSWAWRFRQAHVQCLQTLLLPGTELNERHRSWKTTADPMPPYGVISTSTLSREDIRSIEALIHDKSPSDCMTRRFIGTTLPDLFKEKIPIPVDSVKSLSEIPGFTSRRALIFSGEDLYAHRQSILPMIHTAILSEPNMLWQFVLQPVQEEPLDLVDDMIAEIKKLPNHWIDRFASVAGWGCIASRRVFVLLKPYSRCSPSWIAAAERLLEDHFY
jgi:radical SAM superfamily enzyme YgiQ (UPF0313 family)